MSAPTGHNVDMTSSPLVSSWHYLLFPALLAGVLLTTAGSCEPAASPTPIAPSSGAPGTPTGQGHATTTDGDRPSGGADPANGKGVASRTDTGNGSETPSDENADRSRSGDDSGEDDNRDADKGDDKNPDKDTDTDKNPDPDPDRGTNSHS